MNVFVQHSWSSTHQRKRVYIIGKVKELSKEKMCVCVCVCADEFAWVDLFSVCSRVCGCRRAHRHAVRKTVTSGIWTSQTLNWRTDIQPQRDLDKICIGGVKDKQGKGRKENTEKKKNTRLMFWNRAAHAQMESHKKTYTWTPTSIWKDKAKKKKRHIHKIPHWVKEVWNQDVRFEMSSDVCVCVCVSGGGPAACHG